MRLRQPDLTGQIFSRLTVLSLSHVDSDYRKFYNCLCECGKAKKIRAKSLINGETTSCGCFTKEIFLYRITKHGYAKKDTVEYRTWNRIKSRCYCPTSPDYPDYGARGIKVCDRWLDSFENFLEDIGLRPSANHSLDRYPNNETGNYEPSNCRWGTDKQQSRNKRNNVWIEYNGINLIQSDWAKELNITLSKFKNAMNKYGNVGAIEFYKKSMI